MSITAEVITYKETVKSAYLAKTTAVAPGANTYAAPTSVDSIKQVQKSEQRSELSIYASGKVFRKVSKHSATNLGIDAISLPSAFVRWALGHSSDANGGFGFDKSTDVPTEFALGIAYDNSDGTSAFEWYPRCVLSNGDETVKDPGASPTDPSTSYSVVALPYGADDVIRIEYDQQNVLATKVPLTEAVFFATVLDSVANTLVGTETVKA